MATRFVFEVVIPCKVWTRRSLVRPSKGCVWFFSFDFPRFEVKYDQDSFLIAIIAICVFRPELDAMRTLFPFLQDFDFCDWG
jgi:hypothetical protein